MANNGLTFIPNQAIIFDLEDGSNNGFTSGGRNQIFLRDDQIEFQIKREVCGNNLVCVGEEPVLGDDLIENGDFATDDTGWNYGGGSPWVYSSGAMSSIGINDELLYQEIASLAKGTKYRVGFTVKNYDSGDVRVQLGDGAGAGTSDYVNGNGTYSFDLYFNDFDVSKILAFSGESFIGEIDDVSIKPITYCYSGAGWIGDDEGNFTHLPGFNIPLAPVLTPIASDNIYAIQILITGMTAGTLVCQIGDSISGDMNTNDTYNFYLDAGTGTDLNLIPSTDFDGVIKIVSIYEQTELNYIYLLDSEGNEVADLSVFTTYVADRINVKFSATDIQNKGIASVGNGCYRIAVRGICNPANANMAPNPTFSGGDTNSLVGWEKNNGSSQYDFTGGIVKFKYSGTGEVKFPILRSIEIPELVASDYSITIEITEISTPGSIAVYAKLDNYTDNVTPTQFSTVGSHTVNILGYDPNGITPPTAGNRRIYIVANFQYDGAPVTGHISLGSIDLRPMSEDLTNVLSNVFEIQSASDYPSSKWVEAYNYCSGFGFDFRQFRLCQRVPMLKFNPKYPNRQSTYNYTDGNKERTGAERDKIYQVKTARVDEITHDCFSLQLLCQVLTIDESQYFFEGKSYEPKWRADGKTAIASAQFELSMQPSVVRSNNCGECQAAPSFLPCATYYESAIDLKSAGGTDAGWYMVDGDNELEYYDGSTFTGTTKTGTGYVECLMGSGGTVPFAGPWRFNSANDDWEPIIRYEGITDAVDSVDLEIRIPSGCIAKVEMSEDAGITWNTAIAFKSATELLSGVTLNKPSGTFRFRTVLQCSICIYEGSEVTLYE